MAEHEDNTIAAGDGGTMRSPEGSASPHVWTEEEQKHAKPLPMPTVGRADATEAKAVPYTGEGRTSPGGSPD